MEVRALTETEIGAVMALEHSISDSLSWFSDTEENQRAILASGDSFGIFENGELLGKVGFIAKANNTYEVDGFIVHPQYQNKSYGSTLFAYAVQRIVSNRHPDTLYLYVYPENSAAILLYLKNGFVIAEWIADKYGPGRHRLKMIKPTNIP